MLVCGQGTRGTDRRGSGVEVFRCGTAELFALVEALQHLGTGALWDGAGTHLPLLVVSWDLAACRSEMLAEVRWWGILPFVEWKLGGVGVFGTSPPVQAALQTLAPRPGEGVHEAGVNPALRFQGMGDELGKGFLNPARLRRAWA